VRGSGESYSALIIRVARLTESGAKHLGFGTRWAFPKAGRIGSAKATGTSPLLC
jgi:hypothetical protein